jgi:hypothetical protein
LATLFDVLGLEESEVSKACFTRWLSRYPAVINMKNSLRVLLTDMASPEATEGMKPGLRAEHDGTLKNMRSFMFFATCYFLCDAIKPLHILAANLQAKALTFAAVKVFYEQTKSTLTGMLESTGDGCATLPNGPSRDMLQKRGGRQQRVKARPRSARPRTPPAMPVATSAENASDHELGCVRHLTIIVLYLVIR